MARKRKRSDRPRTRGHGKGESRHDEPCPWCDQVVSNGETVATCYGRCQNCDGLITWSGKSWWRVPVNTATPTPWTDSSDRPDADNT